MPIQGDVGHGPLTGSCVVIEAEGNHRVGCHLLSVIYKLVQQRGLKGCTMETHNASNVRAAKRQEVAPAP